MYNRIKQYKTNYNLILRIGYILIDMCIKYKKCIHVIIYAAHEKQVFCATKLKLLEKAEKLI